MDYVSVVCWRTLRGARFLQAQGSLGNKVVRRSLRKRRIGSTRPPETSAGVDCRREHTQIVSYGFSNHLLVGFTFSG